jgi:hypothetical protein
MATGTGRKSSKDPVRCPHARHYEFNFFGNDTPLENIRTSVRTTGDVQPWLQYFPWCMFHLIGHYRRDIHPFPNVARAATVHELGVALLEAIYSCLHMPYREVGEQLEGNAGEWPNWFKEHKATMTTNQRQAVLLLSSPPVVQYPAPRVHGVSHAGNTHHDCCLRLRAVGHCRWVLGKIS